MGRPFDFSWKVQQTARLRQEGICACCGDDLSDLVEHAHHVIPNQSGVSAKPEHLWLKSTDNCVVLCDQCHWRVHQDGRYQKGAVAPPAYFPHSHGENRAGHQGWAVQLRQLSRTIWD